MKRWEKMVWALTVILLLVEATLAVLGIEARRASR